MLFFSSPGQGLQRPRPEPVCLPALLQGRRLRPQPHRRQPAGAVRCARLRLLPCLLLRLLASALPSCLLRCKAADLLGTVHLSPARSLPPPMHSTSPRPAPPRAPLPASPSWTPPPPHTPPPLPPCALHHLFPQTPAGTRPTTSRRLRACGATARRRRCTCTASWPRVRLFCLW